MARRTLAHVSRLAGLALLLALALPAAPRTAYAVNPPIFTVNSTADVAGPPGSANCVIPGDPTTCTLRAAIMAANHTPGGGVTIIVPAGSYPLTIVPSGPDDESTGDLNVTAVMTIAGAGPRQTFIDATGLNDRVFNVNVGGPVTLSGVSIAHGSVTGAGGGLYAGAAPLTLSNSEVKLNHAGANGGGIYNSHLMVITNSLIDNNEAPGSAGGGIWTAADLQLVASTVSANHADSGAGIYIYNSSTLHLVDSSVAGNLATANGGGLYNNSSAEADLFSATIADNQADSDLNGSGVGGGVYNLPTGSLSFTDTLIADNLESFFFLGAWISAPGNCHGTLTSGGYNMLDLVNCTISGAATIIADPLLGALGSHGGPTPTLPLLAGSPAINAGDPAGCRGDTGQPLATDQRGWARVIGPRCDIGAYEAPLNVWLPLARR
jgi:CSLREA domain-containing protein